MLCFLYTQCLTHTNLRLLFITIGCILLSDINLPVFLVSTLTWYLFSLLLLSNFVSLYWIWISCKHYIVEFLVCLVFSFIFLIWQSLFYDRLLYQHMISWVLHLPPHVVLPVYDTSFLPLLFLISHFSHLLSFWFSMLIYYLGCYSGAHIFYHFLSNDRTF